MRKVIAIIVAAVVGCVAAFTLVLTSGIQPGFAFTLVDLAAVAGTFAGIACLLTSGGLVILQLMLPNMRWYVTTVLSTLILVLIWAVTIGFGNVGALLFLAILGAINGVTYGMIIDPPKFLRRKTG